MKPLAPTCFFLLAFIFLPQSVKAQNYVFEFNPKFFVFPSNTSAGYGISADANFFLSKSFAIGLCYYQPNSKDKMGGLNLELTSDRQKKFGYYGNVKILGGTYEWYSGSTNKYEISSGWGINLGGGIVYRLGRAVNLNVLELNYLLGDMSTVSGDIDSGFEGLSIESGFVFKMIRRK